MSVNRAVFSPLRKAKSFSSLKRPNSGPDTYLHLPHFRLNLYIVLMCRGSSVNIGTCYGLDGLGVESEWGYKFPHYS